MSALLVSSVFRGAITARAWYPLPITTLATTRHRHAAAELNYSVRPDNGQSSGPAERRSMSGSTDFGRRSFLVI